VAAFFRCEGTALLVCAEAILFRIGDVKVVWWGSVVQQLILRRNIIFKKLTRAKVGLRGGVVCSSL